MRVSRRWLWLLILVPLFGVLLFGAFVGWSSYRNSPLPEAAAALQSQALVSVEEDEWLVFPPATETPTTGLILYPGGLVPAAAYAPTARAIAEAGYLVVIVPVPFNLAFTAVNSAADVIAAFPEIEHWAIGGHSLGGAMAAQFAAGNPELLDGLVLWAAYPGGGTDLSGSPLKVVSISGTRDGLATPTDIAASAQFLPAGTTFVPIEGGNHTQFGYYGAGMQSGDNPATISRAAQQGEIVAATIQFLQSLQE